MSKTHQVAKGTVTAKPPFPATPGKAPTKAAIKKAGRRETDPLVKVTDPIANDQPAEAKQGDQKANAMSFSVQQLSAPKVPPSVATPPAALTAYQEQLAALNAKFGIVPKQSAPRADRQIQNGITRPAPGTVTGKIWAAADELSQLSGTVATIAAVKQHATVIGINDHTIKTQYARWRAYFGVKGRLPKISTVQQVQGQYDGLPTQDVITHVTSE